MPQEGFKKVEVISYAFSEYSDIKLELSNRNNIRKSHNMWKLSISLDSQYLEYIKREIVMHCKANNESTPLKIVGHTKNTSSSSKISTDTPAAKK